MILISNLITHWNFFNCCLGTPLPILGHYWWGSYSLCFVYVWPKGHSDPSNKVGSLSPAELLLVSWYEEESEVPPSLKLGLPPIYVPPPVARSTFFLSVWCIIPWSSSNGKMSSILPLELFQGIIHIWVRLVIQLNKKQNASNREDFEQYVRLSICKCGKSSTLNKRSRDGPLETHPDGLAVKVLDLQSRGPMLKTTGWLQGWLSLSSFRGQ